MELVTYKRYLNGTLTAIPLALLERHNTKEGTYAQMRILQREYDILLLFKDDGEQVS